MDDIFIGRTEICQRLRNDVFFVKNGSYGKCYSLIGPNGIGKTTLIRHLASELKTNKADNTYYFSTVLEDGITFWGYWANLIGKFERHISAEKLLSADTNADEAVVDEILDTYEFFSKYIGRIETDPALQSRAVCFLNDLFISYTELGIRIIISIDEFDRARTIFKTGQFFQRLFGLTIKGAAKLNLSIITISRRSVSTIAHHMQEGSNFQDAYPALSLKGFNNSELEDYFGTYSELACGLLDKKNQQEIICLCGRNPGLLMGVRHEIELLTDDSIDIASMYEENGAFIINAFERMCTLMNTEFVDQNKTISSMSIFVQKFIGPVYMDRMEERLNRLYNYGFITKSAHDEKNVFELSGLYNYRDEGDLIYEPMSPFFVDYVKSIVLPNDLHSLSGLLERTERGIRKVICEVLSRNYPDTWENIIAQDVPKKDDYLDRLREVATKNDYEARNLSISKLNVLAFVDYFKIIKNHWDIMSPYFSLYESQKALKEDMSVLNSSRNTSAHLNLEILNDSGRRSLREICEFILRNITRDGMDSVKKQTNIASVDKQVFSVGDVVTLVNIEMTSTGVLRGTIQNSEVGASLSKKYLKENGIYAKAYIGKSLSVKLMRWDENAQKYNAEIANVN